MGVLGPVRGSPIVARRSAPDPLGGRAINLSHTIDEVKSKAYTLCAQADNALRDGSPEAGKTLMAEAAALDATYAIRAEHFGVSDERTVRVAPAIRRILKPALEARGFTEESRNFFVRHRARALDSIYVGRDKFGGRLGLMVAVCVGKSPALYFDWKLIGNRSGSVAYKTQLEVESACEYWLATIRTHVLPWLERHQ